MALLTPGDFGDKLSGLTTEEAEQVIEDAEALALLYAPCIANPQFNNIAAAKAIIRKAVIYDYEASSARRQTEQTGPYSITNFAPTRSGTFYSPSQIEALKALCKQPPLAGAYSVQLEYPDAGY